MRFHLVNNRLKLRCNYTTVGVEVLKSNKLLGDVKSSLGWEDRQMMMQSPSTVCTVCVTADYWGATIHIHNSINKSVYVAFMAPHLIRNRLSKLIKQPKKLGDVRPDRIVTIRRHATEIPSR